MPTRTEPAGPTVGWIGTGRMGYEMAARLAKGGADVLVWNRTRAKAEPLAQYGAKVAHQLAELAARDVVFCMVSTWKDVKHVMHELLAGTHKPRHPVHTAEFVENRPAYARRAVRFKFYAAALVKSIDGIHKAENARAYKVIKFNLVGKFGIDAVCGIFDYFRIIGIENINETFAVSSNRSCIIKISGGFIYNIICILPVIAV